MASMAIKKVDGPAKIHQVEVSWTWKINSSCAFDTLTEVMSLRKWELKRFWSMIANSQMDVSKREKVDI